MFTRRAFTGVIAAGAAATQTIATAAVAASPGRRAEAAALRAYAEKTHPRGREATADPAWKAHWDKVTADVDRMDDAAYVAALTRGLAWFKDGHTTVLPFDYLGGTPESFANGPFGVSPPFRTRTFHDGVHVTSAKDGALPLLGARIIGVGGLSDVELMRRFIDLWPGNNKGWGHRWSSVLFSSGAYLKALGAWSGDGPVRIEARRPEGRPVSVAVSFNKTNGQGLSALARTESARERWAGSHKGGNYVHPLPERRAIYISVDDMTDIEGRTFEQLTRDAFAAMGEPAFDRVVLDLRRNGGGNNYLGDPLRRGLARSPFNRPGGIYVMTSPVTFSAAQCLATRLERETFALFVGEPTGGAPNHYGDAQAFKGDVTGVTAIVSTIPWFDSYPQDPRNTLKPDLPSPNLFADWRDGRDPALDLALSHTTDAAPDELDRMRMYFFARQSQREDWRPFWA